MKPRHPHTSQHATNKHTANKHTTNNSSSGTAKATPKKGEQKDSVLSALDFAQTRSKSDAALLWDAKYGERGSDGKMTREQYGALRRKIGGTVRLVWGGGGQRMFGAFVRHLSLTNQINPTNTNQKQKQNQYKDFFKSYVEEEQVKTIKTYYKPEEANGTVPYLPFLVGVVVAMLGATVAVVAATS
jgi:hypothetical protein